MVFKDVTQNAKWRTAEWGSSLLDRDKLVILMAATHTTELSHQLLSLLKKIEPELICMSRTWRRLNRNSLNLKLSLVSWAFLHFRCSVKALIQPISVNITWISLSQLLLLHCQHEAALSGNDTVGLPYGISIHAGFQVLHTFTKSEGKI